MVTFGDTKLERDYRYCRALASVIHAPADDGGIDLGSEVELTVLQIETTFTGRLSPDSDSGEVATIFADGRGSRLAQNHRKASGDRLLGTEPAQMNWSWRGGV